MEGLDLSHLPNCCAHEHWGSLASIGMCPEGFRPDVEAGATPRRPTRVWDLVLDPYFGGWLSCAGFDFNGVAQTAGAEDFIAWWDSDPEAAFVAAKPHLERQQLTGAFQCIRHGVRALHGVDLAAFDCATYRRADEAIAAKYADLFAWYPAAMEQAHFSHLIRCVHPVFYWRQQSADSAKREAAFTRTVMRIDPLLGFWRADAPGRDALFADTGVEARDAASWEAFLDALFARAAAQGAVGIKQLQAYSRDLAFQPRKDRDVTWSGDLDPGEVTVFQDWMMHACCKRAHDRGWPHQVHVGTHNLGESNPLPLQALAQRYPRMALVLLHCWPFIEEAGWLAKHVGNVYLDTCWEPILSPAFLEEALATWLPYLSAHKIMLSHDATSVEMAVGSAQFTRQALARALETSAARADMPKTALEPLARAMLYDNAVRVYGLPG